MGCLVLGTRGIKARHRHLLRDLLQHACQASGAPELKGCDVDAAEVQFLSGDGGAPALVSKATSVLALSPARRGAALSSSSTQTSRAMSGSMASGETAIPAPGCSGSSLLVAFGQLVQLVWPSKAA